MYIKISLMQLQLVLLGTIIFISGIFFLPQLISAQTEIDKKEEFKVNYTSYEPGIIALSYSINYDSVSNTFTINKHYFSPTLPDETSHVLLSDEEEDKLLGSIKSVAGVNFEEYSCAGTFFCPQQGIDIELNNQTNTLIWTDKANQIINTLYNFELILESIKSSEAPVEMPTHMPPFFKRENLSNFAIEYNKKLGGFVPGQFIHITYNSSQPVLTIENATGKEQKTLNFEDQALLRDYFTRNNLIDIDLENEECERANCDIITFIVSEGNKSKTIKYTNQSNDLLNQIENVGNSIRTMIK